MRDDYGDDLDGEAKDSLRIINNSALQIRKHFQAVLELNSVEWDKEKMEVSLNDVIAEVLEDKAVGIEKAGLVVNVERLNKVVFNRKELKAVFDELIDNSLIFNRDKTDLKLNIYPLTTSAGVKIVFEDNGVGVSPEMSEKIFQLFQQASPEMNTDGVGIGLSLVNKMMITHQGRITHDKSFTLGARFVLEFAT